MPAFIRTKKDEKRWSKAKKAAATSKGKTEEGFHDQDWALTNYIYHKMHKAETLERLVEILSKQEDDDNDYDIQDHGQVDPEELEGMRQFDPEEEKDDADKWLESQDSNAEADSEPSEDKDEHTSGPADKGTRRSGYTNWEPRKDYNAKEQKAIKEHMANGYSHREAERMAGAHKGPKDFQSALTHTIKPSEMSPKMAAELKGLAGHWLDRADRHGKINADPAINPQKFASGKMMQAHEAATKDYNKEHNNFLASDAVKGLKGMERHKAIQAWKNDWKTQNPEYGQGLASVGEAGKHFNEANEAKKQNVQERLHHILTGGVGGGETFSAQAGAQHVGGTKGDEGEGYTSGTMKDPAAKFAESNRHLLDASQGKSGESQSRGPQTNMGQVLKEKAAQEISPEKKEFAMKTIRRTAKPDQMERFNRISAARKTLLGKKPGENE